MIVAQVHVVMYYYYFRRVLGWPVPWKALVTQFQIVQFVFSLACFCVTATMLVRGASCAGVRALFCNLVFNVTLLFQFFGVAKVFAHARGSNRRLITAQSPSPLIQPFVSSRRGQSNRKASRANGKATADHVNGHSNGYNSISHSNGGSNGHSNGDSNGHKKEL
jgi:hypothetical protein